jgi:anaerobic selenocysteine-containing dehydrogenase
MDISRRKFLVGGGVAAAGFLIPGTPAGAAGVDAPELRTKGLKTTTTICPFCAVGCSMIVHVDKEGRVASVEGDEASPINRGSLCSKGAALFQIANNERRLKKVMYRAPGSETWEEKSWDWALERIAERMKETRDRTFKRKEAGTKDGKTYTVNRTEGMAFLGGAGLDNEECYLLSKFARSAGVVYLEHQARL